MESREPRTSRRAAPGTLLLFPEKKAGPRSWREPQVVLLQNPLLLLPANALLPLSCPENTGPAPSPPPPRCLVLGSFLASGHSPPSTLLTSPGLPRRDEGARAGAPELDRLAVVFKTHQQQLPPARVFLLAAVRSDVKLCHVVHGITCMRGLPFKTYSVTESTRQLLHREHGKGDTAAARLVDGSPSEGMSQIPGGPLSGVTRAGLGSPSAQPHWLEGAHAACGKLWGRGSRTNRWNSPARRVCVVPISTESGSAW